MTLKYFNKIEQFFLPITIFLILISSPKPHLQELGLRKPNKGCSSPQKETRNLFWKLLLLKSLRPKMNSSQLIHHTGGLMLLGVKSNRHLLGLQEDGVSGTHT